MSRESAMALAAAKIPGLAQPPPRATVQLSPNTPQNAAHGSASPSANPARSETNQGTTTEEQSAEETTSSEPPIKDDLVSSRIAQIARKEAKYREEQESLKKEREELLASKAKFDPFYEKYKQFEEMKAKDPVAAIKLLGFTETDYVNFVAASEDKSTPEERAERIAEAKIAEFKAEQAETAKSEEQRRNTEVVEGFKRNIGITLKTNAERFELCNFYGQEAIELIVEKVQERYAKDLETNPNADALSPEAAAELVEKDFDDALQELKKLKRFQPKEETTEEETVAKKESVKEEPLKAEVKPGMPARTLTNKVAPKATPESPRRESPSDKRERLKRWLSTGVKQ